MARMKNRDANRKRREDRQAQAKVRQEAYDMLTLNEKLAKLTNVVGASKQRNKIVKALEEALQNGGKRSAFVEVVEGLGTLVAVEPPKEKKGVKAKRQARKDKRGA